MRYRPAGSTWRVEQAFTEDASNYAAQPSDEQTFAVAVIECDTTPRCSPFAGASTLEVAHALLADATLIDRGATYPPFGPPSSR